MEYSIVATVQRARRDVEKGRMQLVLVVVVVKGKQRPRAALELVTQAARTHDMHPCSVVVEAVPRAKYEIEEKRKDIVPPPAPLAEYWVLISLVHRLYYFSFLLRK